MKNNYILIILMAILIPVGFYSYQSHQKKVALPFKCLFATDYVYSREGNIETIHLTQDLSFTSPQSAYFLMNGFAQKNGKSYKVSRTLFLKNGEIEQKSDTLFRYSIASIEKSAGDNLPEDIFEKLMQEYTISSNIFQLHVYPQSPKTYLLGGTFSYMSLCVRY